MTDDPQSIGELWRRIERDSSDSREHLDDMRQQLKRELDDVKKRLEAYVTRDHFNAEKRLLEARITQAEQKLDTLDRESRTAVTERQQTHRDFIYKGIIPVLALLIAGLALFLPH